MDFGLALPQGAHNDFRRDVTKVARKAEEAGFDSLWACERALFPVNPANGMYGVDGLASIKYYEYVAEPLTALTLAGAVTREIRLGTGVLIGPLHATVHLARTLATLDRATGGRVTAGFGGSWSADGCAVAGVDFSARDRALDELIDGLRALTGPNPVTYRGSPAALTEAIEHPKPVPEIPILLGGFSEAAHHRIALKGDGWLPSDAGADAILGPWKQLLDATESAGRDPGAMRLVPMAPFINLTDKPAGADRQPFQGSVAQITDDFAALAYIGAHEVVIGLDGAAASADELLDKALTLLDAATVAGLRGR